MKAAVNKAEVLRASQSDFVVMVLGFLAAETSARPNSIHFNLGELESFFLIQDETELSIAVDELVKYHLVAPVGGYDSADLLEECEFKILPSGMLLLASNKYKALGVFERYAPEYLSPMELFFVSMETDILFEKKWQISGYRLWAEKQAEEEGKALKTIEQSINGFLAPAADRVVNKLDNQEAWDQAVSALDDVIEAVRGDNEYGARDSEDKVQRLRVLETSRSFFESSKVAVNLLSDVLLGTFEYLAKIGVAVTKVSIAIAAVKVLLGG